MKEILVHPPGCRKTLRYSNTTVMKVVWMHAWIAQTELTTRCRWDVREFRKWKGETLRVKKYTLYNIGNSFLSFNTTINSFFTLEVESQISTLLNMGRVKRWIWTAYLTILALSLTLPLLVFSFFRTFSLGLQAFFVVNAYGAVLVVVFHTEWEMKLTKWFACLIY